MLAAGTLAMVEAACRAAREDARPFGGLQVVLVGDFFQLPPVTVRETQEQETLATLQDGSYAEFAFASPAWRVLNPVTCYLAEQYRQEDTAFLEVLAGIRRGDIASSHLALLKTRHVPAPQRGITQLFSHNADVDRINSEELAKLPGQTHVYKMAGRGPEALVVQLKKGCLSPEVLSLKAGARVMFTKNNLREKYVNGTVGMVTGFTEGSRHPIVKTNEGRAIFVEPVEWTIEDRGLKLARIAQIPLRLAWALTVHKSQGMSLDAAHMDLAGAFEYGQGYVALSRVRTLAGLSLAGLNDRALEIHPEVRAKDATFREASRLARETFGKTPTTELARMQQAFIHACGGKAAAGSAKQTKNSSFKEEKHVPPASTYSVDAVREEHPNAYQPWSGEADADLARRYAAGERIQAIATALGRQPGAIRSRLGKLGLA